MDFIYVFSYVGSSYVMAGDHCASLFGSVVSAPARNGVERINRAACRCSRGKLVGGGC